ncbi:hypothetical protein [Priestia megaterium]|nr:hypothetical protein [Priestia megaterium]
MEQDQLKKRQKKIQNNFYTILLLMSAIVMGTLAGVIVILKLIS